PLDEPAADGDVHADRRREPGRPLQRRHPVQSLPHLPVTRSLPTTVQSSWPWPSAILASISFASAGTMIIDSPARATSSSMSRASLRAIASSHDGGSYLPSIIRL